MRPGIVGEVHRVRPSLDLQSKLEGPKTNQLVVDRPQLVLKEGASKQSVLGEILQGRRSDSWW